MVLCRDEWGGWRVQRYAEQRVDVLGQRRYAVTGGLQRAVPLVEAPEQQGEVNLRADRVQPKIERGDDSEVAAAPAHCPEQLRMRVGGGRQTTAIGQHHLDRFQVVDTETQLAGQPAHASAKGEAGDAGVANYPTGDGKAVRLGGGVQLG